MKFQNFERLYLKTSIMALEYFFHYSLQLLLFARFIYPPPPDPLYVYTNLKVFITLFSLSVRNSPDTYPTRW